MFVADSKEVVRIKVKMCNGLMQPEYKKLCIDPQITSFEILHNLLARAFNIQTQFAISYLTSNASDDQEVYVSMLTDWDLDAAIYDSSTPYLRLKVDLKPFDEGLADWDIVSTPASQESASRLTAVQNTLLGTITKTVSSVGKAIGLKTGHHSSALGDDPLSAQTRTSIKPPMSDAEFRTYLDAVGHLIEPAQFRLAVYAGGIEPSLRRVAWRHLLNVYPADMNGRERFDYHKAKCTEYFRLKEEWRQCSLVGGGKGTRSGQGEGAGGKAGGSRAENVRRVMSAVKKDVLRTDRRYHYYAGADDSANVVSLFNLLVTYAVTHPAVSYCQGMSDLAAPILVVEKDEAGAYVSFVALMRRLHNQFTGDGQSLTKKLHDLSLLVRYHDPKFYAYLSEHGAEDMFFTYRWLLLEMKREFPLDDAMFMLEVMWSTLPIDLPSESTGLRLTDSEYLSERSAACAPNYSAAYVTNLKATRRRMSSEKSTTSSTDAHTSVEMSVFKRSTDSDSHTPCDEDVDPSEFIPIKTEEMEELEQASVSIDESLVLPSSTSVSSESCALSSSLPPSVDITNTLPTVPSITGDMQLLSDIDAELQCVIPSSNENRLEESSMTEAKHPVVSPVVSHCTTTTTNSVTNISDCSCPTSVPRPPTRLPVTNHPLSHHSPSQSPVTPPTGLVTSTLAPSSRGRVASLTDSIGDETNESTELIDPVSRLRAAQKEAVMEACINFANAAPPVPTPTEQTIRLPAPAVFGDGNPFLMFLCLATLLQHRDHVMSTGMDYNDLAMYYDKMTRKHDVHVVVRDARILYSAYLKQQQQLTIEEDNADESDVSV